MSPPGRRPALGRKDVLPPPSGRELAELPVHVVVADYPESLHTLRAWGVSVAERGGEALGAVVDRSRREELQGLLAWRDGGRGSGERARDDA